MTEKSFTEIDLTLKKEIKRLSFIICMEANLGTSQSHSVLTCSTLYTLLPFFNYLLDAMSISVKI